MFYATLQYGIGGGLTSQLLPTQMIKDLGAIIRHICKVIFRRNFKPAAYILCREYL